MASVNWQALGVNDLQLQRMPEPRDFPLGISRGNQRYWTQAVNSVPKSGNSAKVWDKALDAYIQLCDSAGIFAFDNRSANNDEIYHKLIRARRTVVRFIESSEINKDMVVRKTERSVSMVNNGFILRCTGHCDFMEEAPVAIKKMGLRSAQGRYVTEWTLGIGDGATFFIANDMINMSGRWHYGYELLVNVFPFVPGKGAASSADLENFILNIIYLPILRAYRPLGLQHRLV